MKRVQPNKRMKLTKLSAAPGWPPTTVRTEVPPRARAGRMAAGTASQLIRGVGRTQGGMAGMPEAEKRIASSTGRSPSIVRVGTWVLLFVLVRGTLGVAFIGRDIYRASAKGRAFETLGFAQHGGCSSGHWQAWACGRSVVGAPLVAGLR